MARKGWLGKDSEETKGRVARISRLGHDSEDRTARIARTAMLEREGQRAKDGEDS